MRRATGPGALLVLLLCHPVHAQAPDAAALERLNAAMQPGAVADVLATDLLGDEELKPVRPGSLTTLVSALRAFDAQGRLAPGVAVELTPWAFVGTGINHQTYASDAFRGSRNLARSSLSLATLSAGEGEGGAVRGAAALRFRLWDEGDWRLNSAAIACAKQVHLAAGGAPAPPEDAPPGGGRDAVVRQPALPEERVKAVQKCFDDNLRWNASQAALGLGAILVAPGGDLEQARAERLSAIASASWPVQDAMQLIATLRYSFDFAQAASAEAPAVARRHLVGGALRFVFKGDFYLLNLDFGLGGEDAGGQRSLKSLAGLLVQLRLAEGAWVESGIHAAVVGAGGPSALTYTTNVKWTYDLTPKGP